MNKPNITIEKITNMQILYIRFRGTYIEFRKNSRKLFGTLFTYAEEKSMIIPNVTKVLTLYHDNPYITEAKNLRTSVAMTVNTDIVPQASEPIGVIAISGRFAIGHFEISPDEYHLAWQYMYNEWLFKGTQSPRDAVPFELYVTEPPRSFKQKSKTDIYIPIE